MKLKKIIIATSVILIIIVLVFTLVDNITTFSILKINNTKQITENQSIIENTSKNNPPTPASNPNKCCACGQC